MEIPPHPTLITLTEAYLGKRANIAPTIKYNKQHPETLDRMLWQFSNVVETFNFFTRTATADHDIDEWHRVLMPNVMAARRKLPDLALPCPTYLENQCDDRTATAAIRTFSQVESFMRRGEQGEIYDAWSFHKTTPNPEDLTAALLLEIYGQFVQRLHPEIRRSGINPVIALEEIMAATSDYIHSDLFIAAKPWYTEEEGFSPQLVKRVANVNVDKLVRQRPWWHRSDVLTIHEVTDPKAPLPEPFTKHFAGKDVATELKEAEARGLMPLMERQASSTYLLHWEGGSPWTRRNAQEFVFKLGDQKVSSIQHGWIQDPAGEWVGTYDWTVARGGRHGDEEVVSCFLF